MFLVSFFAMLSSVALLVVYYRHYHSKKPKAIIAYSTIFAAAVTLLSSFTFYQIYLFTEGSGALTGNRMPWQFGVFRAVFLMVSAPAVAYAISKVRRGR